MKYIESVSVSAYYVVNIVNIQNYNPSIYMPTNSAMHHLTLRLTGHRLCNIITILNILNSLRIYVLQLPPIHIMKHI